MYIISDIDGCLTAGRFAPLDLSALSHIKEFIQRNSATFILASGRSQAYMECLAQALAVQTPYICENGAAIFDPLQKKYIHTAPATITSDIKERLNNEFGDAVNYEPNKDFSLSFRIIDDRFTDIEQEYHAVKSILDNNSEVDVTHSNSAIDILPFGYTKLTALEFLCDKMHVSSSDFIGFGDSNNDVSFLSACGISGAPLDCTQQVAETVNHVSRCRDIYGLIEFISKYEKPTHPRLSD